MMGHSSQKSSSKYDRYVYLELLIVQEIFKFNHFRRLGFPDLNEAKDPEDEVNEYLMRAIDARSIDRLRSEHCKSLMLTFKKATIETKYLAEPDRMLNTYFYVTCIIFFGMVTIQCLIYPL